jgi:chitodextrinase
MVSNTENDVLDYNKLPHSPTVTVMPWIGINSNSKLWLHCECTLADGNKGIIKLAEAATLEPESNTTAFTCDLPLNELSKLGDNTNLTVILMVSSDGSLDEQKLSSVRYNLMFQHPVSISNPTRWLTDIGSNLEYLKVHDLIIPMAHNAGVDQKGASWPADQWAACQDDTFDYQLNNGIRALDLRIYKYGSDSFLFKHSGYDAGRGINDCLITVSQFAQQHPNEIVILGFHEIEVDDLEPLLLSYLERWIGHLCIPKTASSLTIGQIRNRFPGKNVIVAFNNPAWYCWRKVHQTWTESNFNSLSMLEKHMTDTMNKPPTNQLWSLFAAGYDDLGPMRIPADAYIWPSFFSRLTSDYYRAPSKGNMINIDFFAGTGVINRCINATRDRAAKAKLSSPNTLQTSQITSHSIELNWQRPHDLESAVSYELYLSDRYTGSTSNNNFTFDRLKDGTTYHLTVIPVFPSGKGAAAEITATTPDITPPSKPGDLHFIFVDGHPQAFLTWNASTDNVGVKEYQIYRGTVKVGTVNIDSHIYPVHRTDNGTYKVRAVDAAGNFADSDPLMMYPDNEAPSKPTNLRAMNVTSNEVSLVWNPSSDNVAVTDYQIFGNGSSIAIVTDTRFTASQLSSGLTYTFMVRARDAAGNFTDSDPLTIITGDTTAPSKPSNLRATDVSYDAAVLEWNASTDNVGVARYEIFRGNSRIDSTTRTFYVATGLAIDTEYRFNVRALDAAGNYSDSDTLAITPRYNGPTQLQFNRLSQQYGSIKWEPPTNSDGVTGYHLWRDGVFVFETLETFHMFNDLKVGTTYLFEVRAIRNGHHSAPATISG